MTTDLALHLRRFATGQKESWDLVFKATITLAVTNKNSLLITILLVQTFAWKMHRRVSSDCNITITLEVPGLIPSGKKQGGSYECQVSAWQSAA